MIFNASINISLYSIELYKLSKKLFKNIVNLTSKQIPNFWAISSHWIDFYMFWHNQNEMDLTAEASLLLPELKVFRFREATQIFFRPFFTILLFYWSDSKLLGQKIDWSLNASRPTQSVGALLWLARCESAVAIGSRVGLRSR